MRKQIKPPYGGFFMGMIKNNLKNNCKNVVHLMKIPVIYSVTKRNNYEKIKH